MSSKKRGARKVFGSAWNSLKNADRGTGYRTSYSSGLRSDGFSLNKGKRSPITELYQGGVIWE